jgi:hypothetical protein
MMMRIYNKCICIISPTLLSHHYSLLENMLKHTPSSLTKETATPPPSSQPNHTNRTNLHTDPSPIIEEFQYLMEKSLQLFSELR